MQFELFRPMNDMMTGVTAVFVTETSQRVVTEFTPIFTVCLGLSFLIFAFAILTSKMQMPMSDLMTKVGFTILVVSAAIGSGIYQAEISHMITSAPDQLANALVSGSATDTTAATLIDKAAGYGVDRASEAFAKGKWSISFALMGVVISIATAVLVLIGIALLLTAKVALAILAALGPIFILCLLFTMTRRMFDMWLTQVLNFTMLIVLFGATFVFVMTIFGTFMDQMAFDGDQNAAANLIGSMSVAGASAFVLLQLPRIASSLAGGIGLSHMMEARAMGGAAGRAGGAVGAAGRGTVNVSRKAAGLFRRHA